MTIVRFDRPFVKSWPCSVSPLFPIIRNRGEWARTRSSSSSSLCTANRTATGLPLRSLGHRLSFAILRLSAEMGFDVGDRGDFYGRPHAKKEAETPKHSANFARSLGLIRRLLLRISDSQVTATPARRARSAWVNACSFAGSAR